MAESVTYYDVTIDTNGLLTLTGPGHYRVTIQGAAPDEITNLAGIAQGDIVDLFPASSTNLFILRHSTTNGIYLQEDTDFQTISKRDRITLRTEAANIVTEDFRRRFPSGNT